MNLAQKAMMHPLVCLPSEIAADIITKWITLKELLVVDTAFCSSTQRFKFLDVVHCSHCVLPEIKLLGAHKTSYEDWIRKRGIRSFHYEIDHYEMSKDEEYLSHYGSHVGTLKIKSIRTVFSEAAALVYKYCHKLRALVCEDCLIDNSLCQLLSHVSALKELRLDRLQLMQMNPNELLAITCPSIESLRLSVQFKEDKGAKTALVAAFVRMCPNLTSCAIHEFPLLEHLGVKIFTTQCCKLKRLSLTTKSSYVQVSDGDLLSIARCCPVLEHLDVSGSSDLTDDGVFYASFHLPSLRSVCLTDTSIGDSAVKGLARGCPHLTAAFLHGENHTISPLAINQLLSECSKLSTLSLCFRDDNLAFYRLNMALLGKLTTLHIYRPPFGFLGALPQYCPLLHTMYCAEMHSLEGIKEIVLFSPNLRYLSCCAVNVEAYTQTCAEGLWRFLRPDVCFAKDEYVYDALNFDA